MIAKEGQLEKINVFLIDDHAIIRDGLARSLGEHPDLVICGDSDGSVPTIPLLNACKPDVVVLDISMLEGGTAALVSLISNLPFSPKVVVFTMFREDHHAVTYLRAGAHAFLNKGRLVAELVEAIRAAHGGRRYITRELADFMLANQIDIDHPPEYSLNSSEFEDLRALADGLRAVEIARKTNRSVSTINTFVQRIKTKLGLRTVVEVVEYARSAGLLG